MQSVNALMQDEAIRHQEALQRYSNSVVSRIIATLNRSDRRLLAELLALLEDMDPAGFSMERLESMLTSIRTLSIVSYEQLGRELSEELRQFVAYELSYQAQMLVSHVPIGVHIAAVSTEQAYAAALSRPFQGVLLRDVWKDLDANKMRSVRRAIAQGFTEGKSTAQIVRELRGTRAKGYADGLIQKDRRDVEAVVRTALGHTAAVAQNQVELANEDVIKYARWSSTLDSRTSAPCRLRDGKLYTPGEHKPVGHKLPWGAGPGAYHWRCRSGRTFILKSHAELGIDAPEIIVVGRERASMDGAVPAETTYGEWLKKQSFSRQVDVLGETRARLLRDGGMSMGEMYTPSGKTMTLEDLRKRDSHAFRLANI